jgi:murein DD-endopeptidase MepM/ murein hydrolase activator NlpD
MRNPLDIMRIREDKFSHTFGKVRTNNTVHHQGWDLYAEDGTDVYAIAAGTVVICHDCNNCCSYGKQVSIEFSKNPKIMSSKKGNVYVAFYAIYRKLV